MPWLVLARRPGISRWPGRASRPHGCRGFWSSTPESGIGSLEAVVEISFGEIFSRSSLDEIPNIGQGSQAAVAPRRQPFLEELAFVRPCHAGKESVGEILPGFSVPAGVVGGDWFRARSTAVRQREMSVSASTRPARRRSRRPGLRWGSVRRQEFWAQLVCGALWPPLWCLWRLA